MPRRLIACASRRIRAIGKRIGTVIHHHRFVWGDPDPWRLPIHHLFTSLFTPEAHAGEARAAPQERQPRLAPGIVPMSQLRTALHELGIVAEIELGGRWVRLQGDRGAVYVIEGVWGGDFFTWCDIPEERSIERHPTAVAAILAGLRRAGARPIDPGNGP